MDTPKIKVRVPLTVVVDVDAWTLDYGCEPREVRHDVVTYIENLVNESAAAIEVKS